MFGEQKSFSALFDPIFQIILQHPAGLSEYELIKNLHKAGYPEFNSGLEKGELKMFESHFILFHILYLLQEHLFRQRQGELQISCLQIRFLAYQRAEDQRHPDLLDALREYYLNLDNLRKTSLHDVHELLNSFWVTYRSHDKRRQALTVLGLTDPVDLAGIKKQYKALAFRHHPDRGGDTVVFQKINAAMETLSGLY